MNSDLFTKLIVFEMANNHQGSIDHGLAIIKELGKIAVEYKINAAVKFQYRDLDTFIHPDYKDKKDVKHISRFLSTRLSPDEFYSLVCATRDAGLHTMCTPFDEKSVDLILDHGIEYIKVASCSANDWPLLEKIAITKRPVIISTGGKMFNEIDNIYSFFTHRNIEFALLHCKGLYPVKEEEVQLSIIKRMKNRYPNIAIGYSGHEEPDNYSICQIAIALGAQILERHVGLETDNVKLNSYSTNVKNIHHWIEAILSAYKMIGESDDKIISNEELISMNELSRGCYAKTAIKKNNIISSKDVFFAMPCQNGQLTSGKFISGSRASKDYEPNSALFEIKKVSLISDTRSIIHDIKGMLFEAKIVVGSKSTLELSHHYGLEHFRHFGATIINIINREYCKKVIIILPGQQHPMHFHKVKEESFQVLSGTLNITLGDVTRDLKTGEILTVERGILHGFTSIKGCIFEEISTTHVINDSFYCDEEISKLDLMQRKTVLDIW